MTSLDDAITALTVLVVLGFYPLWQWTAFQGVQSFEETVVSMLFCICVGILYLVLDIDISG